MSARTHFPTYYYLAKPGIIYGNMFTAASGFLLATFAVSHNFRPLLLLATLAGIALVIGGACVCNNYIDRHIDQKMTRTRRRALAQGDISGRVALAYAAALTLAGFALLALFTNTLTVVIGVIGCVDYIVLYGVGKRRSVYGTIIGSVSGAMPPVAGYTAVTDRFDAGAIILFLILVCWQMPHFYAIAMYRLEDYRAARLPVLPAVKGIYYTKVNILFFVAAFTLATLLLTLFGYTGYTYLAIMILLGAAWLRKGIKGFAAVEDKQWARSMFFFSLLATMTLSFAIPLGALLP